MSKLKIFIAVAVAILVGAAAFYFLYFKKTPSYTVGIIYASVKNHDLETFERYVDLDSVLNKAFDAIIEDYMKEVGEEESGIAKMIAGLFKKPFVAAIKEKVRDKIVEDKSETPTAEKLTTGKEKNKDKIANSLVQNAKLNKVDFKGVGKVEIDGKISTVEINLYDREVERDFTLIAKMRKLDNGDWLLYEIVNFAQYLKQGREAQLKQEEQENALAS